MHLWRVSHGHVLWSQALERPECLGLLRDTGSALYPPPTHTHTAEEGQSLGILDQEEAWTKQGRKERRLLGQPQEALGLSAALQLGDNFLDAELPYETFGPQNELSFLVGSHKVP